MKEKIIDALLKLTLEAKSNDEVPVACVITRNEEILCTAINTRNTNKDPLGHAEINCIKEASKKLDTWILDDCIMYVSLFPCKMCREIISECRIKNVYYILDNKKEKNNNTLYNKYYTDESMLFEQELVDFFKTKR